MNLTNLYTWICFLLTIIICKISQSLAKPTYAYDLDSSYETYDTDRYGNGDNSYSLTYGKPLTEDRLKKLNTGYYYVDDGYIAPVYGSTSTNQRRHDPTYSDDSTSGLPNNVRFTPIVRYKQTRTKRKKLFVPNFFG
ncbi:uncharacterized protein [Drosophila tropicalis]|uniref:uncharacterized protein n=1 Tax=Drosophila tropicalis TaxID=46794 RepID=UPI0035ABD4E2